MIHYFQLWFLIDKQLLGKKQGLKFLCFYLRCWSKGRNLRMNAYGEYDLLKKYMLCHHFPFLQITLSHKAVIEDTNRCSMQQEPHRKNLRHTPQHSIRTIFLYLSNDWMIFREYSKNRIDTKNYIYRCEEQWANSAFHMFFNSCIL